jgi:hypothetical protein
MAGRSDLLALTVEGLTQIANAGLVKRAQRDLDAGEAPDLNEAADGTIEARFADGTLTRLPAGRLPSDATCSCPSSGVCRHRIALVLAYQRRNRDAAAAPEDWDPVVLDSAAFEASLSTGARAELARLLASPLSVKLERGAIPVAHLPMATVRFLAPNDIAYARCDCVQMTGCVHVALALRAFAASQGAREATLVAATPTRASGDLVATVDAALRRVLVEGVTAGTAAHARDLDQARNVASRRGATWLVLALEALTDQIEAYEARSARYDDATSLTLMAELFARTRSTNATAALGVGEAMETPMAKTRLVSLGARITARGSEVTASVLLADTDTGAAMLMEKRFSDGEQDARARPTSVDHRLLAPALSVRGVGLGQILTAVARRRADGTLMLGQGARGKTVLLPQASLAKLPPPLHVDSVPRLLAELERRPPDLIRPRNRVADVHVFDVERVLGQAFVPGTQLWQAAVTLPRDGGSLHLERRYDAGAPSALPALFAAAAGDKAPLTQIAGTVRAEGGAIVCEPWSLFTDRFIVPDLEANDDSSMVANVASRPKTMSAPEVTRLFLAGAVHAGRRQRDLRFVERGRQMTAALRDAGFEATAQRLAAWLSDTEDVAAFGRVAVWLSTLLEN